MTSNRNLRPCRFRLGGWPVAAVIAVPITALILSAGPAEGLHTDVTPTDTTTTSTTTSTAEPTPPPTSTVAPTATDTTTAADPSSATTTSTPAPTTSSTTSSSPTTTTASTATLAATATTIAPGLGGGPATIATLGEPGTTPTYLPAGQTADGLLPFQSFRVVVQLYNGGPDGVDLSPRLEFRAAGATDWQSVPEQASPDLPVHAAQEWIPAEGGSAPAPAAATIATEDFHLALPTGLAPTTGHRSSGANPAASYSLAADTVTEQEFTVALSVDAAYGTTYEFRVVNGDAEIAGLVTTLVTVGATPSTILSPDQSTGQPVQGAQTTTAPSYLLLSPSATTTQSYVLVASDTTSSATSSATPTDTVVTVGPNGPGTIHDPGSSTTSGQCGVCHQTHSAQSQNLVKAPTTTEQCYQCHAGGVGGADVQAEYNLGQPANDPTTRSYYSHDTTDPGDHTLDSDNEFQGKLTRHSQCTDCHDPHGAKATKPVMTSTGWTAPGGFTKVSGVAVANGAAGTAPTYTWLDGMVQPVTAEYQLCFKCHSGFTELLSDVPGKPSHNVTDLAVELNPANPSYHPIEAPGRNQTQKLADSLAGGKLWKFKTTDTVRCVNCHANNTGATSSDATQNTADATLTVHASTNRGILIRPYEDRVLSAAGQFYDANGAALCLACHLDTPFMNRYRPAAADGTNFVFHGLHMSGITSKGSGGLDIDTPGAGQGNARCAECHFNNHGTTQLPSDQKIPGDRLVLFAPDVLPSKAMGGVPTFTKTATGGTCTLTCHGKDHQGATYSN